MKRTIFSLLFSLTFIAGCGNDDRFAKVTHPGGGGSTKASATAEQCKKDGKWLSINNPKTCVSNCLLANTKKTDSGQCECADGYQLSKDSSQKVCEAETGLTDVSANANGTPVSSQKFDPAAVTGSKEIMKAQPMVGAGQKMPDLNSPSVTKASATSDSNTDLSCANFKVTGSTPKPVAANTQKVENLLASAKAEVFTLAELKITNVDKDCATNAQPDLMSNYEVQFAYTLQAEGPAQSGKVRVNTLSQQSGLESLGMAAGMKVYGACLDTSCDRVAFVFVMKGQASAVIADIRDVQPSKSAKIVPFSTNQ